MLLGYNTNGFAFHRLDDCLEILAELGYRAAGLTIDHHTLNPYSPDCDVERERVREQLARLRLRSVVETGARFLLDPWRKHQPTLISPSAAERGRRVDFLCRAIRLAESLGADCVSFWSGTAVDGASERALFDRMAQSLEPALREAERAKVRLALEPEPGMLIDTLDAAKRLFESFEHPLLGLTVDIGHLHCQREGEIAELLRSAAPRLFNVHLEDMKAGVHDHLLFGEGEIDFHPVRSALADSGYEFGVYVELSRHSHDAVRTARDAYQFLAIHGFAD